MCNKKAILGLLFSAALMAALTGCGKAPLSSNPADVKQTDTAAVTSEAESPAPETAKEAVLYIGAPDQPKTVSIPNAGTAEELIGALSKETGWNLSLSLPPAAGELQDTLIIALSADSAIYNTPPEQQKDSYHVFDSEEYVLTVLNSVSETLCRNLDLNGVYFTSPDGGLLSLENGGYSFCYSNLYCWDYAFAKNCNQPLPEDEIGDIFISPSQLPIIEGTCTLTVMFKRPNMQPGDGSLTIYNEDGSVLETISVNDTEKVQSGDITDYERNYYCLKKGEGTSFHFYPENDFKAGNTYSIGVSEGAFLAEGGLKTQEIAPESWSFPCLDMKLTVTPKLGHWPVIKAGESVTYHFQFPDSVVRVYVEEPDTPANYSCSARELTSDGDITFTPNKPGEVSWEVKVELDDGNIVSFMETVTVTE